MITAVFEAMDADGDGLLSVNDVKAYFRTHLQHNNNNNNNSSSSGSLLGHGGIGHNVNSSINGSITGNGSSSSGSGSSASGSGSSASGSGSSDVEVRKWIAQRDVDQDGAVGLAEFVASYAMQLDPASKVGIRVSTHLSMAPSYPLSPLSSCHTPSHSVHILSLTLSPTQFLLPLHLALDSKQATPSPTVSYPLTSLHLPLRLEPGHSLSHPLTSPSPSTLSPHLTSPLTLP